MQSIRICQGAIVWVFCYNTFVRKLFSTLFLFFVFCLSFSLSASAQGSESFPPPPEVAETYLKARVIKIVDEGEEEIVGKFYPFQKVQVEILNGEEKGETITIEHGGTTTLSESEKVQKGDSVVLRKTTIEGKTPIYVISDRYRLHTIMFLLGGFFLLVTLVAGKKGIGAIIGMLISLFIILQLLVPQILSGANPITTSITCAILIMTITMFLAHGVSLQTATALFTTTLTLFLTGVFAFFTVSIAHMTGLGSEDIYMLQFGLQQINTQGLLLGGIIIGALGVLDDITTTQTATIFTLAKTNKALTFAELMKKGMHIGKEHVASLVNTLVLAYAGASLGLFILFVLNPIKQPSWVILNSEVITEEVIRTIVGSTGLVLAVPIATVLAAYVAVKLRH